jgi:hypothetical protein
MTTTNLLSKCCTAPVEVQIADEGTSHWTCQICEKPCDILPNSYWNAEVSPKVAWWAKLFLWLCALVALVAAVAFL